jgi:nucleotide-binding universal stress UspA family protein
MFPAKKIVCPTDFSEAAREGIAQGKQLALHFGAEVVLVHVLPVLPSLPEEDPYFVLKVPEYERLLHAEASRKLRQLAEEFSSEGVPAHGVVGHGPAAGEIVRIAEEEHADMIVLSTHGDTGWRHFAFGSVAEKVVRHAHCPVLTVRQTGAGKA